MERPKIEDIKVLKYVEYLEKQLSNYSASRAVAKSYLGFKNFVDQMSDVMLHTNLIIEEVTEDGKDKDQIKAAKIEQRKQQQYLERSLDISDRVEKYQDALERMEKKVNQTLLAEVSSEQEGGSIYEDALKEVKQNATK